MDRFEYHTMVYDTKGLWGGKVNSSDFQHKLNRMGAEGWELVSVVATNQSHGSTRSIVAVFKRRISERQASQIN